MLSDRELTIGRSAGNAILLHDKESSRIHAAIRFAGENRKIVDLNSSNGVFVNGERVRDAALKNGDQIQIGRTLFLYSRSFSSKESDLRMPAVNFLGEDNTADQSKIVHAIRHDEAENLFQKERESEWLDRAKSYLNLMYHTTLIVSQTLDIDNLLARIIDLIFDGVRVDRACIFLYNSEENQLVPQVSKVRTGSNERPEMTISRTILDYVLRKNEGVLTSDAPSDQRWDSAASILRHGIREAICVPMQGRYGLVGMIYIDITIQTKDLLNRANEKTDKNSLKANLIQSPPAEIASESGTSTPDIPTGKLTFDHLKLMVAVGHQAALAVEDTRYYRSMMQGERLAAIGQTVAVLSHHIKNILQGISGGGYLIKLGLNSHNEDSIRKGWGIVEKNQKKISDLILDMLTFSKERQPYFEENDLNQVLTDVHELMSGRCLESDIDLDLKLHPDLVPFYFDKEQIHRAITNLVSNAIDAVCLKMRELSEQEQEEKMEQTDHCFNDGEEEEEISSGTAQSNRGHVRIQSLFSEKNGSVLIIIDDNGPGVPEELRETLFRPFFSKNKSGGTGIGLAVTNKIIQEHKGSVTVDSSPFGGARFVISLPFLTQKPDIPDNDGLN